ncbi:hypothetical protein SO802_000454 [Lithocarpus litseifolius]|uniref:Retrotransposon Copia-like N-terminal domain-containing protein n=1 Tax=Lithocarpus litseifolius TaxID=425828 RepID=A0AAW2DVM2_9ROSI
MLSMMTVKLDCTNYVVWKHQIEVTLETYSMIDAIDDSVLAPDHYLKESSADLLWLQLLARLVHRSLLERSKFKVSLVVESKGTLAEVPFECSVERNMLLEL